MEKVIKNGKVAILYSPGFGAGWYSWNISLKQLIFHPKLVEMVENNNQHLIDEEWLKDNLVVDKNSYVYTGGAKNLRIKWIPEGTLFKIDEYDGAESVTTQEDEEFIVA